MSDAYISVDELRGMIGTRVRYQGITCSILEVLEDGPALVLISVGQGAIQSDQFGNPKRRVPETFTIPVFTPEHDAYHPAYLSLGLISS